jgi:BirA family biotin operon repressor/biotin-[acetyl-CoA-carboxylase] ligase
MPKGAGHDIDQPWVDLRGILGPGVSRNRLAARVLSEIAKAFAHFERHGLESISEEWKRLDLAMGRRIVLNLPHTNITGIARGVDGAGALLVETRAGIKRFLGGEISLRLDE